MTSERPASSDLIQDLRGDVLWLTLNRPERRNALTRAMVHELRELFLGLRRRTEVRVVILRGAAGAFCAGLDLKELQAAQATARSTSAELEAQREISEIVIAMRRCPQPIIALVDGAAAGGGFALALASDVRIATPAARMNAAFIRIGLGACDIGVSYFLPRMIGASAAAEYMLTGRFITADRALQLGLVSQLIEADDLDAAAQSLADDMLAATPLGLRLTKEALGHAIDAASLDAAVAMEDRNQILCLLGEDFPEGVAAFLERRPPVYGGAPVR